MVHYFYCVTYLNAPQISDQRMVENFHNRDFSTNFFTNIKISEFSSIIECGYQTSLTNSDSRHRMSSFLGWPFEQTTQREEMFLWMIEDCELWIGLVSVKWLMEFDSRMWMEMEWTMAHLLSSFLLSAIRGMDWKMLSESQFKLEFNRPKSYNSTF